MDSPAPIPVTFKSASSSTPGLSPIPLSVVGSIPGTSALTLPEPTGVNDQDAINDLIAENPGGSFTAPRGARYTITAPIVITSGVTLDMTGATVVLNADGAAVAAFGQLLGETAVTATANVGSVTLTSTASVAPGEFLLLQSDQQINVAPGKSRRGEWVRVAASSAGQIRVSGPIVSGPYDLAQSPRLQKVQWVEDATVRGGTWIGGSTEEHKTIGIDSRWTKGLTVSGGNYSGLTRSGIRLFQSIGAKLSDITIENLPDDPDLGFTGYGIDISSSTEDSIVSNCIFRNVWNAVATTSALEIADIPAGEPRDVLVSNCVSRNSRGPAFTTSASGNGILFTSCESVGSNSHGFSIMARNVDIFGCSSLRSLGNGLHVAGTAAANLDVSGCTFSGCGASGVNLDGVGVGVSISNTTIRDTAGPGINVYGDMDSLRVRNTLFELIGKGAPTAGIWYTGGTRSIDGLLLGNTFVANRNGGTMEYAVRAYQSATNTVLARSTLIGNVQLSLYGENLFQSDNGVRDERMNVNLGTLAALSRKTNRTIPGGGFDDLTVQLAKTTGGDDGQWVELTVTSIESITRAGREAAQLYFSVQMNGTTAVTTWADTNSIMGTGITNDTVPEPKILYVSATPSTDGSTVNVHIENPSNLTRLVSVTARVL